jgi:hypothetical protein
MHNPRLSRRCLTRDIVDAGIRFLLLLHPLRCLLSLLHFRFSIPSPWIPYLSGPFSLPYCCPDDQLEARATRPVLATRRGDKYPRLDAPRIPPLNPSPHFRLPKPSLVVPFHKVFRWGPWVAHYDSSLRKQWENMQRPDKNWHFERNREELVLGCREMVEDYSRREMSVPSDKLAALSGIARRYHEAIERKNVDKIYFASCRYLAGV